MTINETKAGNYRVEVFFPKKRTRNSRERRITLSQDRSNQGRGATSRKGDTNKN